MTEKTTVPVSRGFLYLNISQFCGALNDNVFKMLAILFANIFAPLIDNFVMRANINRRLARHVNG